MEQRDPIKQRFGLARYASLEPLSEFVYETPDEVRAICIGPESDLDSCYVFPRSDVDPVLTHTQDNTLKRASLENLSPKAIKVSVERPFVGRASGPFTILPKYSKMQRAGKRAWPFPETNRWASDSGGERVPQPFLELQFYREAQLWLPTERAPYEATDFMVAQGGVGVGAENRYFPGFGRRRVKICLEMTGYTSGTLTWTIYGFSEWQERPITSANGLEFLHTIATGTETANFDRTYLYNGMFDSYQIQITDAGTPLNNNATVGFLFEAYDR